MKDWWSTALLQTVCKQKVTNKIFIYRECCRLITSVLHHLSRFSHTIFVPLLWKHGFSELFVWRASLREWEELVVCAKCFQAFHLAVFSVSEEQMTAEPGRAGLIPRLSAFIRSHSWQESPDSFSHLALWAALSTFNFLMCHSASTLPWPSIFYSVTQCLHEL